MHKTTLYLPETLQQALRNAARREGRPQAALVREALDEYLSRQRPRDLRFIGVGEDSELAGRDTEAWLRAAWDRR